MFLGIFFFSLYVVMMSTLLKMLFCTGAEGPIFVGIVIILFHIALIADSLSDKNNREW